MKRWGRWRVKGCAGWLAASLLCGCAHYQPQPISPAQTAADLEARGLSDPGLRDFLARSSGAREDVWPKTHWDLRELTLAAFYFHPDLAVARARWQLAVAGETTAAGRLNPSITVNPGYDSQIPGNYSPWLVPVTFDVPVETAGKRGKREAAARCRAEAARWTFQAAVWQVRAGVRARLVEYAAAGRRLALRREQSAIEQAVLDDLEARQRAGEISRMDCATARLAVIQAQAGLADARSQASLVRGRLAAALGLPGAALDGMDLGFDLSSAGATDPPAADARRLALQSRADILAALADYAAADADLRLAVAGQYPDLHLGPGYAWNNGNAGDNEWSLGVTLEIPLLNQNQGPIAEALARRRLAAATFLQLQAQVLGLLDQAVSACQAARRQGQAGAALVAGAERQQADAAANREAGETDRLAVLSGRLESNLAAQTQLDAQVAWQQAQGSLEDALQCPVDDLAAAMRQLSSSPSNFSPPQPSTQL